VDSRHPSRTDALEQSLAELAGQLDLPMPRDLTPAVRERILIGSAPRRSIWSRPSPLRRAAIIAPLAAVLLVAIVLIASPSARTGVADQLGLPFVSISAEPTPVAVPAGSALQLGVVTTLDSTASATRNLLVLPPTGLLGEPDAVYLLEQRGITQVSYVYRPTGDLPESGDSGVGLLISQIDGVTNASFIEKQLDDDTALELVLVNGERAFWLSGQPHVFYYQTPDGAIREESIRLAGNVLIWQQAGITLRIESALARDEVIRIAEAMTGAR
jgi:hypothetical protein